MSTANKFLSVDDEINAEIKNCFNNPNLEQMNFDNIHNKDEYLESIRNENNKDDKNSKIKLIKILEMIETCISQAETKPNTITIEYIEQKNDKQDNEYLEENNLISIFFY